MLALDNKTERVDGTNHFLLNFRRYNLSLPMFFYKMVFILRHTPRQWQSF